MNPYYQDNFATVYHGNCEDILPNLGMFDLLLTDPPYGIGENSKKVASRWRGAKPKDYGFFNWDKSPPSKELLDLAQSKSESQIIWGGNYFHLPPSSCWLVWDKMNSGDFADCELAWTNLPKAIRLIKHMWNGMIRKGQEKRFHPTQKPLDVISWCFTHVEDPKSVLDPFGGSGTTAVAAKNRGILSTTIEMDERYCEIAAMRLQQEVLAL